MPAFSFDATSVAPAQKSFGPLPNGTYECVINNGDIKATKAGTGEYLELEFQVISGEHAGRRVWERLNINNPNKQAEDIAREQLAGLCMALNIPKLSDTDELLDIPVNVYIEIDRKEPDRNRIRGYSSAGAPAPAARPAPAQAPAAAAPAAAKKPWQR